MPTSANGPRVYATEAPNKFIVISRGHFIRYANRHGSFVDFQLEWIEKRISEIRSIEIPNGFELRLRGVFYNDKLGAVDWYLDCLYEKNDFYAIEEPTTELEIARSIEDHFEVQDFEDYQINNYEVNLQVVHRLSDSYDPDHHSFYKQLPGYL